MESQSIQTLKVGSAKSSRTRIKEIKALLIFSDLVLILSALYIYISSVKDHQDIYGVFQIEGLSIILGMSLFWFLSLILDLYDIEKISKTRKAIPVAFFSGASWSFCFILVYSSFWNLEWSSMKPLLFAAGFTLLLVFWRSLYAFLVHKNLLVQNAIVLASETAEKSLLRDLKEKIEGDNFDNGFKIERIYRIPDGTKEKDYLTRTIHRMASQRLIDLIILAESDHGKLSGELNKVLLNMSEKQVAVVTYMQLYEELKEALPLHIASKQLFNMVPFHKGNINHFYLLWHKGLNMASGLIGISMMLMLAPLIWLLNFFWNKGPLFYSQVRIGKGGREFVMVKFRSMQEDAEKFGATMSNKDDSRITPLGKILRKTRIDELPQFWSVLRGEMNLIGPRPERKIFVDQLNKSLSLYNARHMIRPGITGWAQVKYPYGMNLSDSYRKLEFDLYYIKNRSVTLDLRILYKTINTMIFSKGQ